MRPRIILPTEFSVAPFTVGEALALPIGESRLRGDDLARPFWGVRDPTFADDLHGLCRAYLTRAHPSAFFSHITAARIWGIRLPFRLLADPTLDVGVPNPKRAQAAVGIRGHKLRLDGADLAFRHGLPVTSAARTLCDIASLLSDEELLAAADTLLWIRQPLTTGEALAAAVARHRVSGRAALHRVVPFVSDHSDSSPESVFRWRFRIAGLPEPDVNVPLFDADGLKVATPDLSFRDFREAFDYEGDHHRTDAGQWQVDIARVRRLEGIGWHSTRGAALDLHDSRDVIEGLTRALRAKGWRG
jgi:hypothetical protein